VQREIYKLITVANFRILEIFQSH